MSDIADKSRRSASRVKQAAWRGAALGAAFTLAALVPPAVANAGAADSGRPVASGSGSGEIAWTTADVAPGAQVRTGVLRNSGVAAVWTVTVQAPAVNRLTGVATWAPLGDRAWADSTAGRLREAGFEPRLEQVLWDEYADTPRGTMGWQVRVGRYASQDQAGTMNSAVSAAGFRTSVEWTGYDGRQAADAENIHVAVLDPARLHGTIAVSDGGNVADREDLGGGRPTRLTDRRQRWLLHHVGLRRCPGYGGRPVRRARQARVDGGRFPCRADPGRRGSAAADRRPVHHGHRTGRSGNVRGAGNQPGAGQGPQLRTPRRRPHRPAPPRHHLYPGGRPREVHPAFRAPLPTGPGVQTVLDKHGIVVSTGGRGGVAPEHGSVLQGTGAAGNWLMDHAHVGKRLSLREVVRDSSGRQVRLGPDDSIVSAAPTLVEDGRIHIDAATEGTLDPQDLSFGFAWSNVRQPRTLAGIDGRGRLLLVTVDGRQPGVSEGFTLGEAARFMRSLGAVQALNLDGGGSSAMAVKGSLVNVTSDATGERAVGDTIQVLPGRRSS